MSVREYYEFIRNNVKLLEVELVKMECINRGLNFDLNENEAEIKLMREVEIVSDTHANIFYGLL